MPRVDLVLVAPGRDLVAAALEGLGHWGLPSTAALFLAKLEAAGAAAKVQGALAEQPGIRRDLR